MKQIYKITIKNWSKHQQSLKKNHSHFLFSKRFFDDTKISLLNQNECLLFINLLCIAADFMSDSFEIHSKMFPNLLRISDKSLSNSLETLQSFQLLTYEKVALNTIQNNTKEKNTKEKKLFDGRKKLDESNDDLSKLQNKELWECYYNAYALRYGIAPIRNAQVSSQISLLRKKLGIEEAKQVIDFYLKHNDSFYLKKTHEFGLCLKDAETLRTQMLRGVSITGVEIKKFERAVSEVERKKQIEKLWENE